MLLSLLLGTLPAQAQVVVQDPLSPVWQEVAMKDWDSAARKLEKAEKQGLCKEAVCLTIHGLIAEGTGDGAQAVAYARRAAALFGPDSGLNAGNYNALGASFYQRSKSDPELLKLAETAFRQADSVYDGGASNIRFNLATVLRAQGRAKEAKAIMDALEADGLLINPGMAILGDFQRPELPPQ
ncbi:MAG TPA: hypothetical protein VKK31_17645 [Thermoanaerobaculia bacterium]|nr:hypothetical protein [Thermoanaerobaculia bacterium]